MRKKIKEAQKLVDNSKVYSLDEALELLPKLSVSKFTGKAEMAINFRLNDKQKQTPLRISVTYPHQFGDTRKVLVLAEDAKQKEAEAAGADYAGLEEYVKKIEEGWMDFDVVIATPSVMPKIAKLGKFLGRKGLMPNPKNNTVTEDVEKGVKLYKSGKKDYKMTDQDTMQIVFGSLDMSKDQLEANANEVVKTLQADVAKFGRESVKSIFLSPTMGPSIKVDTGILFE